MKRGLICRHALAGRELPVLLAPVDGKHLDLAVLDDALLGVVRHHAHARAAIPVVPVGLHPIRAEIWHLSLGLIPTLKADFPLAIAVDQPPVGGRRVVDPTTAACKLRAGWTWPGSGRRGARRRLD